MKCFRLADVSFHKSIDLRLYKEDITQAVAKVKPDAEVIVESNYFSTIPELGKMESIQVSKLLRMGGLKDYTMYRSCLFNSYQMPNKQE